MKEKGIFAVPTFTIFDYFAHHRESQDQAAAESAMLDYKIAEFKKQIAAGVPFAVGSDVGPFPHGTQAHEFTLMVRYGMKPLAVLQADMINGAKLLRLGRPDRRAQAGLLRRHRRRSRQSARRHLGGGACELCDEEWRGGAAVSWAAECTLFSIRIEKFAIPAVFFVPEKPISGEYPYALLCVCFLPPRL